MNNTTAVMHGLNDIRLEDREVRSPGPREAVVRVAAVGVCGSDTAYLTLGRIGNYVVQDPIVLGHEASGVVSAVGEEVRGVAVGDRVAIEPGTPCYTCAECRLGRYHLCPDLQFLATPPYDGALQQFMTVDSRTLFPLPETMTFDEGALLEPLSVGLWACRRAQLEPGDRVLVSGAGPVGLLAAAAALALGASEVTVTDLSQFRLGLAHDLGCRTELVDRPGTDRFDVLLECSGAPGALADGLHRLRQAGRAAVVGIAKDEAVALPLPQLNPRELTISLVNRYAHTWPTAIALVASGRIRVAHLVTHRFELADTADALMVGRTEHDSVKAVIYPNGLPAGTTPGGPR